MRPYSEEVLRAIQGGVAAHFGPELRSSYAQAQLAFGMLLFTIVQRDYDSAVPDLMAENAGLRGLLAEAGTALAGIDRADAATARAALAELPPAAESLRLSALRKENDALRSLLCQLTPLIEPAADEPALAPMRDVRKAIYAHLSADARRRIFPILST